MEDRRGQSSGPLGGGGFPIPMGAGGGGLGLIILVVLALLFGGNIVGGGGSSGPLNPGGIDETVTQADSGTQPGTQTGTFVLPDDKKLTGIRDLTFSLADANGTKLSNREATVKVYDVLLAGRR